MVRICQSDGCGAHFTDSRYLIQHQSQCIHYKLHQATSVKKRKRRISQKLARKQAVSGAHIEVSNFNIMNC